MFRDALASVSDGVPTERSGFRSLSVSSTILHMFSFGFGYGFDRMQAYQIFNQDLLYHDTQQWWNTGGNCYINGQQFVYGTWNMYNNVFFFALDLFICFTMDSSIKLVFAANPVNCGDIKVTGNKAFGYVNLIWKTNDNSFLICSVNSYQIRLNNDYILVSINIYCKLLIISGKIPWHFINFCINYSEASEMHYHGNSILMNMGLQSTTNSMVFIR